MGEVKVELELENALDRERMRLGQISEQQVRLARVQALVDRTQPKLVPRPESPFLPLLKLK